MPVTFADVIRVVCWFWGVFPLCYYVALAVVCGMYRRWISFAFAVASATVLVIWMTLNAVAIACAARLQRRQQATARAQEAEKLELSVGAMAGDFLHEGHANASASPLTVRRVTEVPPDIALDCDAPRVFARQGRGEESDINLSSIHGSSVNPIAPSTGNSGSSTLSGLGNPLATTAAGAMRGRRGIVVHAQPATTAASATASSERQRGDAAAGSLLTPPEVDQPIHAGATAAIATSPQHPATTAEKKIGSDSGSGGSDTNGNCLPKADAPPPRPPPPQADAAERVTVSAPAKPSKALSGAVYASRSERAAYMMPLVTLYATVFLSLLVLASSLLFQYETHCLMLAYGALCVPYMWASLSPLVRFFAACPDATGRFHWRVLRVLTHWVSIVVVWLISLAVYVAALALDAAVWTPYQADDVPTPAAIRTVSYLAPIPSFIIVLFFVVNAFTTRGGGGGGRGGSRRDRSRRHGGGASARSFRGKSKLSRAESKFGPLGGFAGTSPESRSPVAPPAPAEDSHLPEISSDGSLQMDPENSTSTLSSIMRSTMGSSIFVPPANLASPSTVSSKARLRESCASSSSSVGGHNTVVAAAHTTSLPQLKTVTILYVAYRNIYDDAEAPRRSSLPEHPYEDMAPNRTMQQTVSANYEALMEAIDDAREVGSADANAYVLTAHEDALCLVWGLMPFGSEPVLLALEKARQISEAFRSRPKPPPTSTEEQLELVAAVVSAPHSLVGFVGGGGFRSVHFFSPHQHVGGVQLLQRGLTLYRRLPSMQTSFDGSTSGFSGILMNGRAWHNTASQILARPCGIKYIPELPTRNAAAGAGAGVRRLPMGMAARAPTAQYPIMYEFLDFVHAKEEEWHLVVQRQERLGAKFGFLSEATQLLQQGDPRGARDVLSRAMQKTECGHDADNITLAHIMLEDIDRVSRTKEVP